MQKEISMKKNAPDYNAHFQKLISIAEKQIDREKYWQAIDTLEEAIKYIRKDEEEKQKIFIELKLKAIEGYAEHGIYWDVFNGSHGYVPREAAEELDRLENKVLKLNQNKDIPYINVQWTPKFAGPTKRRLFECQKSLPTNIRALRKLICKQGLQDEVDRVNLPISAEKHNLLEQALEDYSSLLECLENIKFYASESGLKIPDNVNMEELYQKAYIAGLEEYSKKINNDLEKFVKLAHMLGVNISKDIEMLGDRLASLKEEIIKIKTEVGV